MHPDQLSKLQPLQPLIAFNAENNNHAEEHSYKQATPTCPVLIPLRETDPEEIGRLWNEVRTFKVVTMEKALPPTAVLPSDVATVSEFRIRHLVPRKISIDYGTKVIFVYRFFGTQKTDYVLHCQDCPWIVPGHISRFMGEMPHSYSRTTFIDMIQSTLLVRTPLDHPHDNCQTNWHAERCLDTGGHFDDKRWAMAPDLSKLGGLAAPPKRPGRFMTSSASSPAATPSISTADPNPTLWQSPHVSYWLRTPKRFSLSLLNPVFSLGRYLVFPYFSIFYSQPYQHRRVAVDKLAMAGSTALYNRFRIAAETNPSKLKHFGLTVSSESLDSFQLWLITPAPPPSVISRIESSAAKKWNGASMSMLLWGRWSNQVDVRDLADWVNEIHRFGTGVYADAVEQDLRGLAGPPELDGSDDWW